MDLDHIATTVGMRPKTAKPLPPAFQLVSVEHCREKFRVNLGRK